MLYYIDLFCGAGGTTTGLHQARDRQGNPCAEVVACVNHDPLAIKSHARNHADCLHYTEDMRTLDLSEMLGAVGTVRQRDPKAVVVLWASLECTHFSNAAGGRSRDEDSRTLADHLNRYVEAIQPDYVQIENVREFMSWGPLVAKVEKSGKGGPCCPVVWLELADVFDLTTETKRLLLPNEVKQANKFEKRYKILNRDTGQYVARPIWMPESRTKGRDYLRWVGEIQTLGNYRYDWRLINAADHGAYTSRSRFFALFAKPGLPIAWPQPTHARNPKKGLFTDLLPWRPVRDVLDFADQGDSIFGRNPDLSEKTFERIYAGLVKQVARGNTEFLSRYYSGNPETKSIPVDGPSGTITCIDHHALVQPAFLVKYLGNNAETGINVGGSVDDTAPTITTQNRLYLAQCAFLTQRNSGEPGERIVSVDGPARTVTTTGGNQELVQTEFLVQYNGNSASCPVDEPAGTVTTKDRFGLVQSSFLDQQYGCSGPASVDDPAGSITTKPKLSLVQASGFLDNTGWFGNSSSLNDPAPTLVARTDKSPLMKVEATHFIANYYSGGGQIESLDGPTTAVTTIPKQRLIAVEPWLLSNQHHNVGTSIHQPAPTILTGNHHYLMHSYHEAEGWPSFVRVEEGHISIVVLPTDSEVMVRIKRFMAAFGIVDIRMRMLRVRELKRIQGFPEGYYLAGNQTEQKKFLGNAVIPVVARRWAEALHTALLDQGWYDRLALEHERLLVLDYAW
jgi:DNA (cytosine-5)-methyltransferase 1